MTPGGTELYANQSPQLVDKKSLPAKLAPHRKRLSLLGLLGRFVARRSLFRLDQPVES